MIRCICAVLIFTAVGGEAAFSQQPPTADSAPTCSFSQIFRKTGWTVPGLDRAIATGQRSKLANLPGVSVSALQPAERESSLTTIWCSSDYPGRIEIEEQPIWIEKLWSYDLGGHTFAYRLSYTREAILSDGRRVDLGAESSVYFYDIDGSGRFTTQMRASGGVGFFEPTYVPGWVSSTARGTLKK